MRILSKESKYYIVDWTPYYGVEINYSGDASECIKWNKDNNRGDVGFHQFKEVTPDLATGIFSAEFIEDIYTDMKRFEKENK